MTLDGAGTTEFLTTSDVTGPFDLHGSGLLGHVHKEQDPSDITDHTVYIWSCLCMVNDITGRLLLLVTSIYVPLYLLTWEGTLNINIIPLQC